MRGTKIIDGKVFAATVRARMSEQVAGLASYGQPGLVVDHVGVAPTSGAYARSKGKRAVKVSMKSGAHGLLAETIESNLLALIAELNEDDAIHEILVQIPLLAHLSEDLVINTINPAKNSDGFQISTGSPRWSKAETRPDRCATVISKAALRWRAPSRRCPMASEQ